ncbi:MAG TPA: penicillin-binding transpeptidase domain-containing protein, partial [Candidatus Babeliaceae bacterium]|nr:penicillin-binding transpeptidase domain-containing protein [Candidatus Babeliaceae bacterium]
LQLGCAFCMIARNGAHIKPLLLKPEICSQDALPIQQYSCDIIHKLKDILQKTVTQGTAHRAQIQGYHIMGKTGTANLLVTDKSGKKHYDPKKNIFTFASIVERGDYQRVVVTFLKQARRTDIYASSVAVPLAERIIQTMLIKDKVL